MLNLTEAVKIVVDFNGSGKLQYCVDDTLSLVKELAKQILAVAEKANPTQDWAMPIEKLGLSARARNSLARGGINYVEQLMWLERNDVLKMRNMGQSSFDEINEKVKSLGLRGWE